MKIKYALLFIAITSISYAQPTRYDAIDAYVKNIKKTDFNSIPQLAGLLTKTSKNQVEKVRAIYSWIGYNIEYDIKAFRNGTISEQTAESAFKSNKAVCQGYCELFNRLCALNGIKSEIVTGYSKGFGYSPGKVFKNTDHAWVVVKIDDEWHLLDPTWGAGYIDEKFNYIPTLSNDFFFTKPEKFIFKHLPSDPIWELLPNPILLKTFEQDSVVIMKALSKTNTQVNYLDTLKMFDQLDSLGKIINSNLRIVKLNPTNSEAWYKLGFFYFTRAWERMAKLNDPKIQSNRSLAKPLAMEASQYLNLSLQYLNEVDKLDSFFADDVKQKKQIIALNIKNLVQIIKK